MNYNKKTVLDVDVSGKHRQWPFGKGETAEMPQALPANAVLARQIRSAGLSQRKAL